LCLDQSLSKYEYDGSQTIVCFLQHIKEM